MMRYITVALSLLFMYPIANAHEPIDRSNKDAFEKLQYLASHCNENPKCSGLFENVETDYLEKKVAGVKVDLFDYSRTFAFLGKASDDPSFRGNYLYCEPKNLVNNPIHWTCYLYEL